MYNAYIIHFCICHESSLTVGIDLIYYQCSGVVDGTRYAEYNVSHIRDLFWSYAIYFVYEYCNHVGL